MTAYVSHAYDRVLVVLWEELRKTQTSREALEHTVFRGAVLVEIPGDDLAISGAR